MMGTKKVSLLNNDYDVSLSVDYESWVQNSEMIVNIVGYDTLSFQCARTTGTVTIVPENCDPSWKLYRSKITLP